MDIVSVSKITISSSDVPWHTATPLSRDAWTQQMKEALIEFVWYTHIPWQVGKMQKKNEKKTDHIASSFFGSFSLVFCENTGGGGNAYGYVPWSFASTAEGGGHFVILRVNSETLLPRLIRKTCSPVNLLCVLSSVYGIILHKNKIKTTKQNKTKTSSSFEGNKSEQLIPFFLLS